MPRKHFIIAVTCWWCWWVCGQAFISPRLSIIICSDTFPNCDHSASTACVQNVSLVMSSALTAPYRPYDQSGCRVRHVRTTLPVTWSVVSGVGRGKRKIENLASISQIVNLCANIIEAHNRIFLPKLTARALKSVQICRDLVTCDLWLVTSQSKLVTLFISIIWYWEQVEVEAWGPSVTDWDCKGGLVLEIRKSDRI